MMPKSLLAVGAAVAVVLAGGLLVRAQDKAQVKPPEKKASGEQEREVKQTEVPPAALAGLKKLAGSAAFTEFAEEIEHGHKFYEGSWKGPEGNVDALVTESGDMVELEEKIPAEKVPAAVRAEAEKEAGKDAKMSWEKKTYVMYEVHFRKGEKGHEILFTPDGRRTHEEGDDEGEEEAESREKKTGDKDEDD